MKETAAENECVEGGLALTSSILGRGRRGLVIHRGRWPEGRGSARTLVAGGLPLSGRGPIRSSNLLKFYFLDVIFVGFASPHLII